MSQVDVKALTISILFLLAVLNAISFILGNLVADFHWRKWCVKKDIAQYNPKNGDWELIDKYEENK